MSAEIEIQSFLNYIRLEKRYSEHTIVAYKADLTQFSGFLARLLNNETPNITHAEYSDIRSWVVSLMEEEREPRSIRRKVSVLKAFYKFLLKKEVVSKNPAEHIITPKIGKPLPEYVEKEKIEQLFEEVNFGVGFSAARDRLIMEILYATGMRRGELTHLKINNVDMQGMKITILGKGNKMRIVPFGKWLGDILEQYFQARQDFFPDVIDKTLLLTDKGEPVYEKLIYNKVRKYLSAVTSRQKRSPHTLRHTFATHLLDEGADLNVIKELLGHSSLAATQIYTHTSVEKLKSAYSLAHPKAKKSEEK